MRVTRLGFLVALCFLTLTGCTASVSHHAAWQTALGGIVGGVLFFGLAKLLRSPDGGGSPGVSVVSMIAGILMFVWATQGIASLFSPEPTPGIPAYRCTVTADHHVVVSIQNTGTLTLLVGSVTVQLQDAAGKPQGKAVMAFLPTVLKLPHHIEAGAIQTSDLGDMTPAGQPEPARCAITGSAQTSGNGRGSLLSNY